MSSLFRWIHIVAGILWIGLLFFFNWVNSAFAPTMDADTKKKVVPELMPRALYWFRWGAAWTWVTGVLLLLLVFYHGGLVYEGGAAWSPAGYIAVAWAFIATFIYDAIMKSIGKSNLKAAIGICFVLIGAYLYFMQAVAHFSYRAMLIHLGVMFGSMMAFNVWYRIWPAQRQIITAIKNGAAPDSALVGLAGLRSRHNTYMSLPLVWAMMNQHSVTTPAASPGRWWITLLIVAFAWWIGTMLFRRAPKVKGF